MSGDWLEEAIASAIERGEFDDLPGAGRPLDGLGGTYDPAWWAKRFVAREKAAEAGVELAAAIDRQMPRLLATATRAELTSAIDDWNTAITALNRNLEPADRLTLLDPATILRRWEALRSGR